LHGEQTLICEEGIWPALMIGYASSYRRALILLAQDGAESPSDEAVQVAKPCPRA
jgi:hypothetical protein